jgi:hypothetical protein
MNDDSGGVRVPVDKGGQHTVWHAGSAITRFILESKLVFLKLWQ